MDVGSSQPPGQAGRARLLSLRRRKRDLVPSTTTQCSESTELLLPPHPQLEDASPPGAPSRASGESELKFETRSDKVEEEEREAQGTELAGGKMEQSGHVCQVPLSGVGSSKKSRAKKVEVDCKKERAQGRLDLGLKTEDGDFTDMPPPEAKPKRRRKRKRNEQPQSYLEAVEDDELQLALALSASLDPLRGIEQPLSTAEDTGRGKKRKRGRKGEIGVAPPLLTVSSSQARNILAERAEQILEAQGCGDGSDDEIPCTPAFATSELAQPPEPQRYSPTAVLRDHDDESVALTLLTSDHEEEFRNDASDVDTLKRDHQEAEEEVVAMEETVEPPLELMEGSSKLQSGANLCDSEQGEQREDLEVDMACDADQQTLGEGLPLMKDLEVLSPVPQVSFHANSQELSYQTLWKLSSYGEEEDVSNFYVPGLAAVMSPRKGQSTVCRTCRSDPCLALSAHNQDAVAQPAATDMLRGPACVTTTDRSFSHGVDKLIVGPTCVPPGTTTATSFSHGVDKLVVGPMCVPSGASHMVDKLIVGPTCVPSGTTRASHGAGKLIEGPTCVPSGVTRTSHGVGKLIVDLYNLIGSPLLSDAIITTRNGARIPAHAVILACRSPALDQVISQSSERPILLDFSEFDEETVFAFLECVYTGSTSLLNEENMRQNLAHIAQRWSMEEIVFLCHNWKDGDTTTAGDHGAKWEGKSAITIPTFTDTKLLPSPHQSQSRFEASDEQATLETLTQSAPEHLDTHRFSSAADCTVWVDPSVPTAAPASESFTVDSCDEVVMISPVDTPVCTEVVAENARREDTLLVTSDKDCESTITAAYIDEGALTTVGCTDEQSLTTVSYTDEGALTTVSYTDERSPTTVGCTDERSPTTVSEGSPATVSCTDEGAPTTVSCTDERSPTMVSCADERSPTTVDCTDEGSPTTVSYSMPTDCAYSETMNNSTSDEISGRGCTSTHAVRLPSDVICVSPTPSPVICMSTPSESEKSPGGKRDDVCLSVASSDEIVLCSPSTPLINLLRETELSPRHALNLSGELSVPCVTTNPSTSPSTIDSSESATDWLVAGSPPFFQATCPILIGASPVLRRQCRGNQGVECGVEVCTGTPASCVGFRTPRVERTCTGKQGLVREQCTTPVCGGIVLESDDNITPMPVYRTMPTPILKEECSQFGVKPLPKKQMIAKLQEIYEYTHPLVDKDGKILAEDERDAQPPARKNANAPTTTTARPAAAKPPSPKKRVNVKTKRQNNQDMGGDESSQGSVAEGEDLGQRIKELIMSAKDLYQDILLYKPLELSLIQARLKSAGIAVGKGRLADILDHWCVTYSVPRMTRKRGKRTGIKSVDSQGLCDV